MNDDVAEVNLVESDPEIELVKVQRVPGRHQAYKEFQGRARASRREVIVIDSSEDDSRDTPRPINSGARALSPAPQSRRFRSRPGSAPGPSCKHNLPIDVEPGAKRQRKEASTTPVTPVSQQPRRSLTTREGVQEQCASKSQKRSEANAHRQRSSVEEVGSSGHDFKYTVDDAVTLHQDTPEPLDWVNSDTPSPVAPVIIDDDEDTDSEHEYGRVYAALDLNVRKNWQASKRSDPVLLSRQAQADKRLILGLKSLSMGGLSHENHSLRMKRLREQIHTSNMLRRSGTRVDLPEYAGVGYIWNDMRRPRTQRGSRTRSPWVHRQMHAVETITRAPGRVTKIIRYGDMIVTASVVPGGQYVNESDARGIGAVNAEMTYNLEGGLSIWCGGKSLVLREHHISRPLAPHPADAVDSIVRYCTVNDVQLSHVDPWIMASSGADCAVRQFDCRGVQDGRSPKLIHTVPYDACPYKLLFKPADSLLAVGGSDGYVYLQQILSDRTALPIAPDITHTTADFIWGRDASSDIIFTSSAPLDNRDFTGLHKAFDARTGQHILAFDTQEAGRRVTIDTTGETLVLATECSDRQYLVRRYDARRRLTQAVRQVELAPFHRHGRAAVDSLSMSSDGIYLAVARSDNATHVYDVRFLERGILHAFAHEDGAYTEASHYGVVEAQWIQDASHGLKLLTGGADGCVRLWDTRLASNDALNGFPIARCDYDVSHFLFSGFGEKLPIIVGECSGQVTAFGNT